jgi:hypothetical protein
MPLTLPSSYLLINNSAALNALASLLFSLTSFSPSLRLRRILTEFQHFYAPKHLLCKVAEGPF